MLSTTEKKLLEIAANDMLNKIRENPDVHSMKQHGFDAIDGNGNAIMQVHVIVTRDETDFIEPFTTVVTRTYRPAPQ